MYKLAIILNTINIIDIILVSAMSKLNIKPYFIAYASIFFYIAMVLFIASMLALSYLEFFKLHNYLFFLIYLSFAIMPFIIGYISTFKKEKIFISIQILCLCLSLIFICFTS